MTDSNNQNLKINPLMSEYRIPRYETAFRSIFGQLHDKFLRRCSPLIDNALTSEPASKEMSTAAVMTPDSEFQVSNIELGMDFDIHLNDLKAGNYSLIVERIETSASSHAAQLFKPIIDTLASSGHLLEGKVDLGVTDTEFWNQYLDMFEKLDLHFNDNGQLVTSHLKIFVPADVYDRMMKISPPTAEVEERKTQIINKKREEWFAKRSNRRLS